MIAARRTVRGVTLIELLMTLIIAAIAFMALAVPFVAERAFSIAGLNQVEAQREAQMVLRAIARAGRECQQYATGSAGYLSGATYLMFKQCASNSVYAPGSRCFAGGPSFSGGKMITRLPDCQSEPNTKVLIDGLRTKVANFTVTPLTNKLVRVTLEVTHGISPTDPRRRAELLQTDLFLRNGT